MLFGSINSRLLWPIELSLSNEASSAIDFTFYTIVLVVSVSNTFGVCLLSGALSGSLIGNQERSSEEKSRKLRREAAIRKFNPSSDERWQLKVEELAGRGFELRHLINFYKELGSKHMPHFDSLMHTTTDVVRQAIIPASAEVGSSLASVWNDGTPTFPEKMVTHNWDNLFRDLVAAIVADALGEDQFCWISFLLDHDIALVEKWLESAHAMPKTYWVCAISVSQHDGICGSNPGKTRDSVTGLLHPVCTCGKPKCFNTTEPTFDGRSIKCEMNQFDDMIEFLAHRDSRFSQVIAVDSEFMLFSRAWCVAEVAKSYELGMVQHVLCFSADCLEHHRGSLCGLRIQDMKATRPEDVDEILAKITDVEGFNLKLQTLIFDNLFARWHRLDAGQRLIRVGRIIRYQSACSRQGCVGLWSTDVSPRSSMHIKRKEASQVVVTLTL